MKLEYWYLCISEKTEVKEIANLEDFEPNKYSLFARVYNSSEFNDGTIGVTEKLESFSIEDGKVVTCNGTTYELGKMYPNYQGYIRDCESGNVRGQIIYKAMLIHMAEMSPKKLFK